MWVSLLNKNIIISMVTVISLFAGCGGSSLGYKWAGYTELLAIDFDKNAVETFKLNFPEIPIWQRDIKEITGKEILDFCKIKKGELDILDGSPPCQGFSTAGKRNVNDNRNELFKQYVRLINDLQPKVFIMENVLGMAQGKMKGMFIEIIKTLKALNYQVKCKQLNAKYYNVPQSRKRLIFIGIRNDLNEQPVFPKPNKNINSVKKAIHDLNNKQNSKIDHIWIDESPEGRNTKTYPLALKAKQGQKYARQHKRCFWDKPSSTITTGGIATMPPYLRSVDCHPLYTRTFSILEYKLLFSYPDNFKFANNPLLALKRIGNSVPPKFMQAIAETIKTKILET